jgi:hypothetical protein
VGEALGWSAEQIAEEIEATKTLLAKQYGFSSTKPTVVN